MTSPPIKGVKACRRREIRNQTREPEGDKEEEDVKDVCASLHLSVQLFYLLCKVLVINHNAFALSFVSPSGRPVPQQFLLPKYIRDHLAVLRQRQYRRRGRREGQG